MIADDKKLNRLNILVEHEFSFKYKNNKLQEQKEKKTLRNDDGA